MMLAALPRCDDLEGAFLVLRKHVLVNTVDDPKNKKNTVVDEGPSNPAVQQLSDPGLRGGGGGGGRRSEQGN